MNRIDVNKMSRQEKEDLLYQIDRGDAKIVNGEIVSLEFVGAVFYDADGRLFLDTDKTIEIDKKYINEKAEASEENAVIFLPIKEMEYNS